MTRSPAMNGRCLVIFLLLIALVPVSERPTAAQSATPTSPQGRLVGVRLDGTGLPLVTVDLATGALLTSTSLPFNFFFSSAFDSTTHRYFLIGQGPGPTFATQMVAVDTTGGALVPSAPISLSSPVGLLQFDPAGCQVSVKHFGQCDAPWGSTQYGFHPQGSICAWGCALTSLSIALESEHVKQIPACFVPSLCFQAPPLPWLAPFAGPFVDNNPGAL